MKTYEYNHGNDWRDKLLNSWPFLIDADCVNTLFRAGICHHEKWVPWIRFDNGTSLFYNGLVFIRVALPFWIGINIRFGKRFLQMGIGWKLNGRFGTIFRIQTDKSAAEGSHGANYGQAKGYECGPK